MGTRMNTAARRISHHINICKLVLKDPRTPKQAKATMGFAVACLPFPLSFTVSPILIIAALRMIPQEIIEASKPSLNS